MKNRASSHLVALLLIIGFEAVGYYAVHRAALIRGYETSAVAAVRDLFLFVPLILMVFVLTRFSGFAGNWTLYTTAVLLFAIGLLVQYRLYQDTEFGSKSKADAIARQNSAVRTRYINETYGPEKKKMLGLPPTPPQPTDLDNENPQP